MSGTVDSNEAVVTLNVNDVAPVTYAVAMNHSLTVAAAGVLGNDTDADSDDLTASIVSYPTYGLLTLYSDGSFGYTPNSSFVGIDSFVYAAYDGALSDNATVTITVVDAATVQRANDPSAAALVPLGEVLVDLNEGGLRLSHALDFDLNPGTNVGLNPALVYNSTTVDVRPIIKVLLHTDANQPLPEEIQLRLTWDGVTQDWITFSTEGHAAGDTYVLAVQVDDAVAATGLYDWSV